MKYLGKIQDPKDLVTKEYVDNSHILDSKTFTGVIGTANNWANATFFFGSVKPTTWKEYWRIKYKIRVYVPGKPDYNQIADVMISGRTGDMRAYYSLNTIGSYYVCYYHELYRLTETGFNNGYGHSIGVRFYSAYVPTDTNYKRTIEVEILETENCTFSFYNSCLKYAEIPGTGSTNYNTYTEMDFVTNGLQETGDANSDVRYTNYYDRPVAGTGGLMNYGLFMMLPDGRYSSFTTTSGTGTKTKNTVGFVLGKIYYHWHNVAHAEGEVENTNNAIAEAYGLVDLRYSGNQGSTLTANMAVYLVGEVHNDGLFYIDDDWFTQTLPTTADGKLYIYLGMAYDTYRIELESKKPIYAYINGCLREIAQNSLTVNGHTVNADVPSGAKFTDTTYSAGNGLSLSGTTFSNSGVTGVKGNSESSYRTGNVNITAANIGAAASSHTHTPNQIAGTSTYGLSGSIDMVTGIRIGSYASNKSFGLPANAIVIEYSNDGGTTWTDYGASDAQKRDLFSETRVTWFNIGKSSASTKSTNDQLRVTIEPLDRYVSFNALYIWMSTQGNTCTVDLERSTIGAKDTFATVFSGQPISGWSGNNIRYFSGGMFGGGSTQTSNNYKYRLTFKMTALGSSTYGSGSINDIRFLGEAVYSSPNNMVSKNHLYTWDSSLNATFPFQLTATGGFIGDLTGTASGNTKYWGNQASTLGSGTPAAATKTFWENSVPNASVSFGYNTSGAEYALAYARGSAGYGSVLKWGYSDKYIRILRRNASNWSDSDWAKIDAGNADTVNGLSVQTAVPSGAKFTDTVTTVSTTGSGNAVTAISASNGALTVTKGSTFLTSFTETDPTVPSWAKASTKPSYTAAEVGAVADCTLSLYNGAGGNPGVAKFCTVNYTGTDSNNGVLFKTTFMAGHGNGVSYNHLQDAIISVGYNGSVSVEIYRYYAQTVTYESTTHYYGDVLYTIDTTNKIVTFYTLMGQYSTTKFSPYKRLNASGAGTITQHTGTASMGASGTVSWATVKWIGGGGGSGSGTVTSVAATGSGGITISGSPITTSGTLTIGVDGSTVINNLSEGSSPAQRNDYIVAQYAGGGTTTTSYHRRKLSNIFAALNSSDITTALGYTPPTTDHTYNFSGTTFYSGNSGTAEHNANSAVKNGNYYYTSNGPATSLGASTTDGALYVQSYSDSWVGQIAQDYRNGGLFVRGKNNGTWQSWQQVYDTGHTIKLNANNLPQFSGAPQYLLGIDAFADGGTMKWQGVGSISVGYATSAGSATDSTKLPLAGGMLTGGLTLNTFNTAQVNMRPNHNSYDGIMSYQTAGNEAWVFSTKNAVTSFMFVNGEDTVSNASDSRWKSLTPGLQIKNNCVSIGALIPDGTTPTYKLDVNGTVNCPAFNTDANNYLNTKSWLKIGVTSDPGGNYSGIWVNSNNWLYSRSWTSFVTDVGTASQMKQAVAGMFEVVEYSMSIPAISSGSTADVNVTDSGKTGYYPLAIVGFQTGRANAYFAKVRFTARATGSFTIGTTLRANAAISAGGTGYVDVLWVKNS